MQPLRIADIVYLSDEGEEALVYTREEPLTYLGEYDFPKPRTKPPYRLLFVGVNRDGTVWAVEPHHLNTEQLDLSVPEYARTIIAAA